MKVYAHRANLDGPGSGENRPAAIRACLERGVGVEVDVWAVDGALWLGHDRPTWEAAADLLAGPDIICHVKNVAAVASLRALSAQFFCLERDVFALCSNGLIWANYGCEATPSSIMCSPELVDEAESLEHFYHRVAGAYGVCTDYPTRYLNLLKG